jgi:hypothetical protein
MISRAMWFSMLLQLKNIKKVELQFNHLTRNWSLIAESTIQKITSQKYD